jgi:mannose-6-phosphate isomerase-like protein (cupin superfamily)
VAVRRIVTGHDDAGRAVVVADEPVDELELGSGATSWNVWRSDAPASYPDDGSDPPPSPLLFPPAGGFGVSIINLRAGGTEAFDGFIAGSMATFADPARPGMHKTATTDFDLVLSGELVLELDDGVEVVLHPGDIVVQSGTRHRWINRGDIDAQWAAFIVGAEHKDAPTA